MDELPFGNALTLVQKIRVELVAQALKYSSAAADVDNLRDAVERIYTHCESEIRTWQLCSWILTLMDASCIIVNIDEVHAGPVSDNKIMGNTLADVLKDFGHTLCKGVRLYCTVTGVFRACVSDSIMGSQQKPISVVIPPLKMTDTLTICREIGLTDDQGPCNRWLAHLLWQAGGVPRYIARLVFTFAQKMLGKERFGLTDMPDIKRAAASLTQSIFMSVQSQWRDICVPGLATFHRPSDNILHNAVSLCISEMEVTDTSSSLGLDYTVEKAQRNELLYYDPVTRRVSVPPLLLSFLSEWSCDSVGTVVLRRMMGVMSARDNESLFLSVVAHRMKAAFLLGKRSVALSILLGIPLGGLDVDVVAEGLLVRKASCEIRSENFHSKVVSNCAIVNTATAPFADVFVRYALLLLHIMILIDNCLQAKM
jgi:hypothetical protein